MKSETILFKKLRDDAIIPTYQTEHAAGMDVSAALDEPLVLQPMQRAIVSTGLSVELPVGYELQIRARSGLSLKNGITMVNGIGTIDADYRGEVGVLVINLGKEPFEILPGMRIAQMVLAPYTRALWKEAEMLTLTERGEGGYGSTGTASVVDRKS